MPGVASKTVVYKKVPAAHDPLGEGSIQAPRWLEFIFIANGSDSLGPCKQIEQAETTMSPILADEKFLKRDDTQLLNILCPICCLNQKQKRPQRLALSLMLPFLTPSSLSSSLSLESRVSRTLSPSLLIYLFIGSFILFF